MVIVEESKYKELFSNVATSVGIIFVPEYSNGCTINSFASVASSDAKNLISFSLKKNSSTLSSILKSETFSFFVLGYGGIELARIFADASAKIQTLEETDRNSISLMQNLIMNSIIFFECNFVTKVELHSSILIIAECITGDLGGSEDNLIYVKRKFNFI